MTLKDTDCRFTALQSALHVWSEADPQALAEKARGFSAGPERTFALALALRAWLEKDLDTAWAWIVRWEPTGALSSVDLDLVVED